MWKWKELVSCVVQSSFTLFSNLLHSTTDAGMEWWGFWSFSVANLLFLCALIAAVHLYFHAHAHSHDHTCTHILHTHTHTHTCSETHMYTQSELWDIFQFYDVYLPLHTVLITFIFFFLSFIAWLLFWRQIVLPFSSSPVILSSSPSLPRPLFLKWNFPLTKWSNSTLYYNFNW